MAETPKPRAKRAVTGARKTVRRPAAKKAGSSPRPTRAAAAASQPIKRGGSLVVVESPAKARTIAPFLGAGYTVKASLGHVRDLPKSRLGVDVDHEFEPKYLVPKEKKSVVDDLKAAARGARAIYLATDPDREGEAISWHLLQAGEMAGVPVRRVVFHEITPEAIREAFAHPRDIDMALVNAQQARRIVDRLVGYSLSPVLWRKVRGGLSAGRVQSVALRMIVDREREILGFVPQEYWSIDAELTKQGATAAGRRPTKADLFRATLVNLAGKRGKITISDQTTADRLTADLRPAAYRVTAVNKKQTQRQPQPPFTTSTLQQEASRKLGFTAQRTMSVAQRLYEGMDTGEGSPVGLITYMRTDSVRVADVAIQQARQYIQQKFGGDFVPRAPRQFNQRARGAQEAHEAIRPTAIAREPERMKGRLSSEEFRLYDLIWKRMVASQMASAAIETVSADVEAANRASGNTYLLRASSSIVVFPGYQELYSESKDDDGSEEELAQAALARLAALDPLALQGLDPKQHFTQPPGRYTDATLVKALEANGIGRPSTYAATLSTIQDRGYVHKEKRQYQPDDLGLVVCDLLTEHFPQIVDIQFTAHMEYELDEIAEGKQEWVPVVREFYGPFAQTIDRANELIPKVEFVPEPTGEACEKCGRPLVFRLGRFGKFIACSGFPECRNAKPILNTLGVKCPKDGGELVEKRGRQRGRVFYGCANFPACDFTSWDKPVAEPCPNCQGLMVQARGRKPKCTQCGQGGGTTATPKAAVARKAPRRQLAGAAAS